MEQKIELGLLAPISDLKAAEVVTVVNYLFGWNLLDWRSICHKIMEETFVHSSQEAAEETPVEHRHRSCIEDFNFYCKLFSEQNEGTLHLKTKEASGYPTLGGYLLSVRKILGKVYPHISFYIDNQFCIKILQKQYYSDGAVLATIISNGMPIYVIEYKPRIPSRIEDIEPCHLSEVLLQAFYLQRCHYHKILHALTDLMDFHLFLFTHSNDKLKLEKYFYYECTITKPEELLKHLSFLCNVIYTTP